MKLWYFLRFLMLFQCAKKRFLLFSCFVAGKGMRFFWKKVENRNTTQQILFHDFGQFCLIRLTIQKWRVIFKKTVFNWCFLLILVLLMARKKYNHSKKHRKISVSMTYHMCIVNISYITRKNCAINVRSHVCFDIKTW